MDVTISDIGEKIAHYRYVDRFTCLTNSFVFWQDEKKYTVSKFLSCSVFTCSHDGAQPTLFCEVLSFERLLEELQELNCSYIQNILFETPAWRREKCE